MKREIFNFLGDFTPFDVTHKRSEITPATNFRVTASVNVNRHTKHIGVTIGGIHTVAMIGGEQYSSVQNLQRLHPSQPTYPRFFWVGMQLYISLYL